MFKVSYLILIYFNIRPANLLPDFSGSLLLVGGVHTGHLDDISQYFLARVQVLASFFDLLVKLLQVLAGISLNFQAVKESYCLPFLTGCWLADALSAAAAAQIANPSQITQLFSAVIGRFEQAKLGAKELGASPAIMKDLSALRDRLLSLSKEAQVTSEQYGVVSEESLELLGHLMGS